MAAPSVVCQSSLAQHLRKSLEDLAIWDGTRRLIKLEGDMIAIPICKNFGEEFLKDLKTKYGGTIKVQNMLLPPSKKNKIKTPLQNLEVALSQLLNNYDCALFHETLMKDLPRNWERHGDLILLPEASFKEKQWDVIGKKVWEIVAKTLGGKRVAKKNVISSDGFRSPQVEMMLGNSSMVEHTDNGIRYCYDVTKSMFSSGNITEKARVAKFKCEGQIVVDMYAGIGYFTLPYLVHAKAERVHACEWNPNAVEALKNNLILNKVQERCIIHEGDNRKVCPKGIADRVNLGLIPSSEEGLPVACAALKPLTGGVLHVHENVSSKGEMKKESLSNTDTFESFLNNTENEISNSDLLCKSSPEAEVIETQTCNVKEEISIKDLSNNEVTKCDTQNIQCENTTKSIEAGGFNTTLSQKPETDQFLDEMASTQNDEKEKPKKMKMAWLNWANQVKSNIKQLLEKIHETAWRVNIVHIEQVKSYAPHVDHLVLDLDCRPI